MLTRLQYHELVQPNREELAEMIPFTVELDVKFLKLYNDKENNEMKLV